MLSLRDQCGLAVILEKILQVRTMRRQKKKHLLQLSRVFLLKVPRHGNLTLLPCFHLFERKLQRMGGLFCDVNHAVFSPHSSTVRNLYFQTCRQGKT